jgi:hypothetical protein
MHAGPIVAQSVVMHVVKLAVQVAVQVVVMHAVQVVALSVTAPRAQHVRRALIARRARVQMIVHSGVNRLKVARPFANYSRLVVVVHAKF